ncbi:protein SUPPRESSOR OF MAX2 1 isoform X2 [Malania oleifera]|uniref:protein SUPPRESSOR OF MAX2 1 isoform X2 n=1 Tax=Malania oleifera TaxID=397392 RepID=UPI0025AE754B|nr:protein SUPPRESSOR OF MAX2 1 isoform X2 [Malania oleifera]
MRAGLSTIQQTLTPEAASVLNHSIAEAGRRNHGQTTPLHVAATLLASPSGFLRQACIRSHPNSSHPLQCRALELCFSVALERLPTAQNVSPAMEPPISNALMAALKRAQAHQRRGCPEQQQQPLLAVKVELEQLIISILDDPSVSRVMREASFSSPAVKATIEQSLNSSPSVNTSPIGLGFRPALAPSPGRNLYLNPRLQQGNFSQSGQQKSDEVKRVIDILLRTKKRNPVLVGESEPEVVVKELVRRIEKRELGEGPLKNVQIIPLEKELACDRTQIPAKLKELGDLIETKMGSLNGGGLVLDLGDLKWLVEQPAGLGVLGSTGGMPQQVVPEMGRAAVVEMGKLLTRFGDCSAGRLWLIGTATCETYLRCQVYHPSMENDWDLQAVPIAARVPLPGFARLGTNGFLGSSVESMTPLKNFPTALSRRVSENVDPARRVNCCPQCMENYEQELAKLKEFEKSCSEVKSEAARTPLPLWLQNAKVHNADAKTSDQSQTKDQELIWKQKTQELQKKWNDTCAHDHPHFHHNLSTESITPTSLPMLGLHNANIVARQSIQPKLHVVRNLEGSLQLNTNSMRGRQSIEHEGSQPESPVRTDLVLGQTKTTETTPEEAHKVRVKDFLGSISCEPQNRFHELQSIDKLISMLDADSFKKLLKGLRDKVWWQRDAASAVATTVTQCKLGNGKRRAAGSKGDIWLLFTGPDRVGKKKMASVLSDLLCGTSPITVSLGSRRDDEESDVSFRGKTALDRIAEAVRRNPCSVIMIDGIDEADALLHGSIKRAIERGRLADSHGREISLGNVIFILTAEWLPDSLSNLKNNEHLLNEEKLAAIASGGWQLRLSISEKAVKRQANWVNDEDRRMKPRKEMASALSFDLNQAADGEDDKADGSRNSSDLTIDHEDERSLETRRSLGTSSASRELLNSVDDAIVFKPVDFGLIQGDIFSSISSKFSTIMGDSLAIEVQDVVLEKILGGAWLGRTGLDEWAEKVLVPSFQQLKAHLPSSNATDDAMVVRLEPDHESDSRSCGDWLPNKIKVVVDGL